MKMKKLRCWVVVQKTKGGKVRGYVRNSPGEWEEKVFPLDERSLFRTRKAAERALLPHLNESILSVSVSILV